MKGISIVIILLLVPFVSQADVDFEVKSECSSEMVAGRRLDISWDSLEICTVSEKRAEKDFFTVSAVTSWFGFGHLKTRGLLTESMNPCGYSPTSEVFFETSLYSFQFPDGSQSQSPPKIHSLELLSRCICTYPVISLQASQIFAKAARSTRSGR